MTASRWSRPAANFCCANVDNRADVPEQNTINRAASVPALEARFLEPPGFVWGSFPTVDGARLRWGHLPAPEASADCVLVGGFAECIEKYFETIGDLTARGYSVWCLDWRGQGGSERPRRLPSRPRPRRFDRDAGELAAFTEKATSGRRPRLLIGHSMGGATALLCLRRYPGLFDAAVLSAPMLGISAGGLPPALMRCMTGLVRATGLGICFIPGAGRWGLDRSPTPELQPGLERPRTLPSAICLVLDRYRAARRRTDLGLARQRTPPRRSDGQRAVPRRYRHPDPACQRRDRDIFMPRGAPPRGPAIARLHPCRVPGIKARAVSRARRDPRPLVRRDRPVCCRLAPTDQRAPAILTQE